MKTYFSGFFLVFFLCRTAAQGPTDLVHRQFLHMDVIDMQTCLDTLNTRWLLPMYDTFRNCEEHSSNSDLTRRFGDSTVRYILSILAFDSAMRSRFFPRKAEGGGRDTSYIFYYTNTEIDDYLNSLNTLKQEISRLLPKGRQYMTLFDENNFMNAYFYMCQSRSMLMASMDNLLRFSDLGTVADSIRRHTDSLPRELYSLSTLQDSTFHQAGATRSLARETDSLLSEPFRPYYPQNQKWRDLVQSAGKDRISTSANTALIDQRKNWWWRTLAGGMIAGLIAGLVVHSMK